MSFTTYSAWAEDALAPHACVLLKAMEHPLEDATYLALEPVLGQDAILYAITTWPVELSSTAPVKAYMDNFHAESKLVKVFTPRQLRAVANALRWALRGGYAYDAAEPTPSSGAPASPPPASSAGWDRTKKVYPCYKCGLECAGIDALYEHREKDHGIARPPSKHGTPVAFAPTSAPAPSVFKPSMDLDLRSLPDGRYALSGSVGGHVDPWFVIKRTVKRQYYRRGRFIWGRSSRGWGEYIEPGRIEIRVQVGDTKELIGEQKASEAVYYGEHEEKLKIVLLNPTDCMENYGKLIGACAYCGRSLTDPLSRVRGIGPDCWEEKHIPHILAHAGRAAFTP